MDRRKRTEDRRQNLHLRLQVKQFLQRTRACLTSDIRRLAIEAFTDGYRTCKMEWHNDVTEGQES